VDSIRLALRLLPLPGQALQLLLGLQRMLPLTLVQEPELPQILSLRPDLKPKCKQMVMHIINRQDDAMKYKRTSFTWALAAASLSSSKEMSCCCTSRCMLRTPSARIPSSPRPKSPV
jgi:hypothetical protein